MASYLKAISECIVELRIAEIQGVVKQALDAGVAVEDILGAVADASQEVGAKFEHNEFFLSDLIMAGETTKIALAAVTPFVKGTPRTSGRVVIGTIEGDLHDIGKNLVIRLLEANGFEAFDLGIDVPAKKFAQKAAEVRAECVGISALLSVTVPTIKNVAEHLENAGLRSKVRIIAGGAALRKEYVNQLKIDAAVNDVVEGLNIVKSWVNKN